MLIVRMTFLTTTLIAIFLIGILLPSCQEASVSCLSDRQCGVEATCVSGQCVGAELKNQDPFKYYTDEMHYRLVSECGICHAASEESVMPPTIPLDQMEIENTDPYKLPVYTAAAGDSGWRIYIDNLTEQRLFASYLDTMQYINLNAPEESLLFAFGRGEVGISKSTPHPKLYTSREELEEVSLAEPETEESVVDHQISPLYKTAPIGYERLLNWARLPHLDPQVIQYNLNDYIDGPQAEIAVACGCHNELNPVEIFHDGGFAFKTEPLEEADLAPLIGLINLDQPEQSALIRLFIGEYDHPNYAEVNEQGFTSLKEAVVPWIESLRP